MRRCLLMLVAMFFLFTLSSSVFGQIYGNQSSIRGFANFQYGVGVGNGPSNQFRAFSEGIDNDPYVERTAPNPMTYRAPTMPKPHGFGGQQSKKIGQALGSRLNTMRNTRMSGEKMPSSLTSMVSQPPTMRGGNAAPVGSAYGMEMQSGEDLQTMRTTNKLPTPSTVTGPLTGMQIGLSSQNKGLSQQKGLGQSSYTLTNQKSLTYSKTFLNGKTQQKSLLTTQTGLGNRVSLFR